MENLKERLNTHLLKKEEVKDLQERVQETRERLTSIRTQDFGEVQVVGGKDKLAKLICALIELEGVYNDKYIDLVKDTIEIEGIIDKLEPEERLLIRKRFIDGKSWEVVAEEMNYTERNVYYKYKKALKQFKSIS